MQDELSAFVRRFQAITLSKTRAYITLECGHTIDLPIRHFSEWMPCRECVREWIDKWTPPPPPIGS